MSDTNKLIEQVAEAIRLEAEYKTGDHYFLKVIGSKEKPLYKELAKAAIEAVNSYKHG